MDNSMIPALIKYRVHVMTVNCLLRNPGEEAVTQSSIKELYLDQLHKYFTDHKKRVSLR
jgi:hypothetical protein